MGTFDGGLNRLESTTGRFIHYQNLPDDERSLSSNHVQTVYIDRQGVLWVGTIDNGLNRFDDQTGGFTRYLADDQVSSGLGSACVSSLYEDTRGQFWVGTNGGGLHLLDRSTGQFTRYQNMPDDPTSLSNNSIWSIYEDISGILWFGTFGTGLDKYHPHKEKFLQLQSDQQNRSFINAGVFAIYEDPQHILWVGTFGQGLVRVDTVTGPAWPVTGRTTDLLYMRDYLTALLDHVRGEMTAGKPREEIVASTNVLKGFADHGPLVERVLAAAYDELSVR